MFFVYVLQNQKGGFYTGHTNNLERRITEHNTGLEKSTKNKGPWKLLHSETFDSRSQAMIREKELKSGKGRDFIKSLQGPR